MKNISIYFEWWEGIIKEHRSRKKLVGHQEIGCHMIFDVNMDGKFTSKYIFVAGSHTMIPPTYIT